MRARTVFMVALCVLAVVIFVEVALVSERVLIWILVSILLAMALNPAVDRLQRLGLRRRGASVAMVYLLMTALVAGAGALIIPTLIQQVSDFIDAVPGYVQQLTAGRGPLGFLEEKYRVVERVQDAVKGNGSKTLAGGATAALDVGRSVAVFVAGIVTITFLTLFMLLEGSRWVDRTIEILPARLRPTWRSIADDIYLLVGRYVTGNLLISVIAGSITAIVLLVLGVPFALALGLLVAILDLIPLAGATLAATVVTLVALSHSVTAGIIVLAFFVVYQQVENHLLQPIIYGRTVKLSPLAILISVLIGAEVAGVVGALVAIPAGGTIQILLDHWRAHRRSSTGDEPDTAAEPDAEAETKPVAKPKPVADSKPSAATKPLPSAKRVADTKPVPKTEPDAQAGADAKPKPPAEAEPVAEPGPDDGVSARRKDGRARTRKRTPLP
ncbi:MAG TPA: AI-2E family transporter [Solirubrobacteraceae bacterium]